MKEFTKIAAQGDFLIIKIDELPEKIEQVDLGDKVVIAHSETGHNHVMERPAGVDVFVPSGETYEDTFNVFLNVKEPSPIVHERSYDTHEALMVRPGLYKIARQREYVSEGFRKAQD